MSAIHTFKAALRSAVGTKAVRHLRKAGQVPVNISRKGAASTSLQMDSRSAEQFNARVVHLAKIEVDGKEITVLRGDVTRHVLNDQVLHIDVQEITESSEITVAVAVSPNMLNCPGVKAGGIVELALRQVDVRCRANAIPDVIEVNLSTVNLMDTLHVSDLVAPAGVTIVTPGRQVLLSIAVSRGMSVAAPVVAADAAATAAATPAAAAAAKPAEGDKKKD